MREWAGSDGVRGDSSQGGEGQGGGKRRLRAAGWFEAAGEGPQGRRSSTRSRILPPGRIAASRVGLMALTVALLTAAAPALRPPRPTEDIRRVLGMTVHQGDCNRCHELHAGTQPLPEPDLLLAPNDNLLCATCHGTPWAGGSYGGPALYSGTGHGSSPAMIWPGPDPPSRVEPDAAGKCLNCHDPHGWTDATGLIPFLALQREEKLCLTCHDGSPASANVQVEIQKPYRHPVTDYSGRHTGPLESLPTDFGTTPLNNRHSECVDCHDPHVGRRDALPPVGNDASKTVLGASRVTVLNGVAGSAPTYTFVPGSDTLSVPTAEYTLCFKCHSSWTTQPAGQTDFARVLNPANPSFHPVEDRGTNPGINLLSFTAGWSATSITRCGDCHGSDFGSTKGPHGSIYRYILKAPYTASPASRITDPTELCFSCHSYDVYANPNGTAAVWSTSRFNPPSLPQGHAFHVGQSVPCYACHTTHGSTTLPHLIVLGRNPGLNDYSETPTGGTCSPTCHGLQTYTINYGR